MKKYFLIALCLLLTAAVFAGCSDTQEPFEEKSYTPDTPVREVILDVRDRKIQVEVSEDEKVHLFYSENSKESYEISVSEENVLTMTSSSKKAWTDYIGGKASLQDREIVLQIPKAQIENLSISSTNEEIALSPLAVLGAVNISSNGGNITFENLDVGSAFTVTVKNGNITGTIAGSYEDFAILANVKKGESNLADKAQGEKQLNISANNGNVQIDFVR